MKKRGAALERAVNVLIWIQLIGTTILIISYNGYCWFFNTSNHSGFSFLKLLGNHYLLIFLLSSIELAIAVKFNTFRPNTNILILTMGLSLFGVLNIIVYDKLNIMMYYDEWIRRGMPDKPISDALRGLF